MVVLPLLLLCDKYGKYDDVVVVNYDDDDGEN